MDVEIEDSDVLVTLAEPPSSPLVVRVLDREGRPAAGAAVSLQVVPGWTSPTAPDAGAWAHDVRLDDPPARVDDQGLAHFAGVPYGWLRVFAHGTGAGVSWDDHGVLELRRLGPTAEPVEVRLALSRR